VVGHGKLTAVVPQLDAVTKRVPIEATIVNDGPTPLLAGTLVRARVAGGKAVPVLKFPHTVLRPGTQDELLVVTGGRLQLRKVEHALAPDGSLLVRKGVGPEDDVVLVAWPEATDGQPVAVAKAGGQP
jgi:multidrug efflux pump subunit AcrA (membrane-fusion protein)